ncbi:hypothetical protein B5S28_g4276 [[Candida] boidinii]|nr:hypothetical protein B5S28_g4276 [[Candida] boidinii]OWB75045.1 hypothetical protein B5S31_g4897 [[Candida] boidinii]
MDPPEKNIEEQFLNLEQAQENEIAQSSLENNREKAPQLEIGNNNDTNNDDIASVITHTKDEGETGNPEEYARIQELMDEALKKHEKGNSDDNEKDQESLKSGDSELLPIENSLKEKIHESIEKSIQELVGKQLASSGDEVNNNNNDDNNNDKDNSNNKDNNNGKEQDFAVINQVTEDREIETVITAASVEEKMSDIQTDEGLTTKGLFQDSDEKQLEQTDNTQIKSRVNVQEEIEQASESKVDSTETETETETILKDTEKSPAELRELVYQKNLKKQIELKRKYLHVAKQLLADVKKNNSDGIENDKSQSASTSDNFKEIAALYQTLTKFPYSPNRSDVLNISLAQTGLISQTNEMKMALDELNQYENSLQKSEKFNKFFQKSSKELIDSLNHKIEKNKKIKENLMKDLEIDKENNLDDARISRLLNKIDKLKDRQKKLTEYSKKIVSEYILDPQAAIFYPTMSSEKLTRRKSKAFRLLEILLNNAMEEQQRLLTGEQTDLADDVFDDESYLLIDNKDDPLVRHLLRAGILIEQNSMNKIKLRPYGRSLD